MPGSFHAPMTQHMLAQKAVLDNVVSRIKPGRLGQPEGFWRDDLSGIPDVCAILIGALPSANKQSSKRPVQQS